MWLAVSVRYGRRSGVDRYRRIRGGQTQPVGTSSVHTLKLVEVAGPKVLLRATSAASRPRAINTLPTRGGLWRASKGWHCPHTNTSNQAEKSIGASSGGTPMSPRYPVQ